MLLSLALLWCGQAELEALSDGQVGERATALLRRLFPAAAVRLEALVFQRWGRDRFSQGAYTYDSVGARPELFDELAAADPPGGGHPRVRWCGEHTYRKARWEGCVTQAEVFQIAITADLIKCL